MSTQSSAHRPREAQRISTFARKVQWVTHHRLGVARRPPRYAAAASSSGLPSLRLPGFGHLRPLAVEDFRLSAVDRQEDNSCYSLRLSRRTAVSGPDRGRRPHQEVRVDINSGAFTSRPMGTTTLRQVARRNRRPRESRNWAKTGRRTATALPKDRLASLQGSLEYSYHARWKGRVLPCRTAILIVSLCRSSKSGSIIFLLFGALPPTGSKKA